MGQLIRKDAAVDDILIDANKTLTNATVRGGRWKDLAEMRLGPTLSLFANMDAQCKAAELAHAPNAAKVSALDQKADLKIRQVYDHIWNEVGRPGTDAALSVLFPEGAGSYTDGETMEQPDRMAVLVTLLGSAIHPKLSAAMAAQYAAEIALEAQALELALLQGRQSGAKVKVLSRVRAALARVVHTEMSHLKRLYKAEGFSESEIHAVIPDRPGKTKKADASGDVAAPASTP